MALLSKMKDKLGIGGVSVKLQVPGQVANDANVDGKLILTTKNGQEIVDIQLKVVEEFTTGRGDDKKTKSFDLGTITLPEKFSIKPGETKEIPFSLPFNIVKSNTAELAEKGGALGAIGKLGKFASNEQSEYFVKADVDVAAAALDPSDKAGIRIV